MKTENGKKKSDGKGLSDKQRLWLRAYLDETNPETFLNKAGSARAAGYKCKNPDDFRHIGYQNSTKLHKHLSRWLDEVGLSKTRLSLKLLRLLDAKEMKLVKMKGELDEDSLAPRCRVLAKSKQTKYAGKDAVEYKEEYTVIAVIVEALEIQRRALDMALRVRGLYAPDQLHLTGLEKLGERMTKANERAERMCRS